MTVQLRAVSRVNIVAKRDWKRANIARWKTIYLVDESDAVLIFSLGDNRSTSAWTSETTLFHSIFEGKTSVSSVRSEADQTSK